MFSWRAYRESELPEDVLDDLERQVGDDSRGNLVLQHLADQLGRSVDREQLLTLKFLKYNLHSRAPMRPVTFRTFRVAKWRGCSIAQTGIDPLPAPCHLFGRSLANS